MHDSQYVFNPVIFKGFDGKYHYLYKITNDINDKVYYGIHSTDNLNDGYFGSGKFLKKAIKRYGKDHFKKTILTFCNSREQTNILEAHIVNQELLESGLTYNLKIGGDNVLMPNSYIKANESIRKQIVQLETGKVFESISQAKVKSIGDCIGKGYTSRGYHYAFLKDVPTKEDQLKELQRQLEVRKQRKYLEHISKSKAKSFPVIDLLTGIVYQNSKHAGDEIGCSPNAVAQSARCNISVYGHIFSTEIDKFKDDPELRRQTYNQILEDNKKKEHERRVKAASKHAKPCVCVETGIQYPTCRDASKAIGRSLHSVDTAVRTGGTAGGYHWKLIDS